MIKTSLIEYLPAMLIGLRVVMIYADCIGPTGTIVEVGHWYGPKDHQALVRWRMKYPAIKSVYPHPLKERASECDVETVHYIADLAAA